VTEQDPSPDASITGDLGTAQYSQFGWMLPYRAAVLAGNRARVDQLLAAGYGGKCWTSDPQWRALLASHPQWRVLSGDDLAQKYVAFLASARP
jgi:hypothetical protein